MTTDSDTPDGGDASAREIVRYVAEGGQGFGGFHCHIWIGEAGHVEQIKIRLPAESPPDIRFRAKRALCFVIHELGLGALNDDLASDLAARLPLGPLASVELAIFQEVAAVQAIALREMFAGGRV